MESAILSVKCQTRRASLGGALLLLAASFGLPAQGGFAQSAAGQRARPCAERPEARQFDFWVGEWDEEVGNKKAGTNSVQLILGDCVVLENWAGAGGMNGKSFNFYNAAARKWQQTWVDDRGGVLEFAGEFKDGAMRFAGEASRSDGTKMTQRLTFFPLEKDRVRQLWEQSNDGGKTWAVVFDGVYLRKKPS